jgi:uroporphyrinogen-III synthase
MGALPITGCVVTSAAEVDWLHEERASAGWADDARNWCIGEKAAARARQRGWRRVVVLERGVGCDELVASIARS